VIAQKMQAMSEQREAHLRLIIDTIPAMAWSVLPGVGVDFVNQRWLDYTGLSSAEALEEPTRTIHPQDLARVMEQWSADMAAGNPCEYEIRLRRADGEYRWFLVRTVPLRDERGNIVKWYGTSTDIEDRKRAEDALRDSEERFAAFMENLPGYAWMKDLQGRYVYVNQMVRGLSGYQSLGKTDAQIWPAELAAEYRANDQQVIAAKKPLHTVEHYLHEGKQRCMVGSKFPIFDKTGNVALVGGAGVDITERIEAEEALRESEYRLRTILQTAMDGFWRADGQGRFLEVNEAYCRMSAYSERELLAMSISDVEAQEVPSEVVAHIRRIMARGEDRFESRHRRKDGRIFPVEVSAQYRTPDGGQMVAFLRDITERKQAENVLRDSGIQLQALARRLVELQESERKELARELHDRVGQNLTALKINIDMLQLVLAKQGSDEVLSRVADSSALLESTMDTIENVMSELRPPMLDEYGLTGALDWHASNFTRRTGIVVMVRSSEPAVRPPPSVEIALFRIAQEALNNVAKHAGARRVEVALSYANGECVMSVQDDGIGINGVNDASDRRLAGFGMVTMRERAQAVGGHFEILALPDRGTRLTVRVPH
jgi:PAS domain S-box-containing protein